MAAPTPTAAITIATGICQAARSATQYEWDRLAFEARQGAARVAVVVAVKGQVHGGGEERGS